MDLEKIIRECIDKSVHLSLATVSGDKPWVCEVHFVYDDDLNLYWRSKQSTRHSQEITANPNVAGNIVQQYGRGEACGGAVYFEGTAQVIEDAGQLQALAPKFVDRLGLPMPVESILSDAAKPDGFKFYKATISKWAAFGKFEDSGMKKYELEWQK